jgi:hypothetical protein
VNGADMVNLYFLSAAPPLTIFLPIAAGCLSGAMAFYVSLHFAFSRVEKKIFL